MDILIPMATGPPLSPAAFEADPEDRDGSCQTSGGATGAAGRALRQWGGNGGPGAGPSAARWRAGRVHGRPGDGRCPGEVTGEIVEIPGAFGHQAGHLILLLLTSLGVHLGPLDPSGRSRSCGSLRFGRPEAPSGASQPDPPQHNGKQQQRPEAEQGPECAEHEDHRQQTPAGSANHGLRLWGHVLPAGKEGHGTGIRREAPPGCDTQGGSPALNDFQDSGGASWSGRSLQCRAWPHRGEWGSERIPLS